MKRRKLGKLEVSEMGFGCMSISANYGPPLIETKASRSFEQPTTKASHSSIQLKFTAHTKTKNLLEKHLHRFATQSRSQPNSASTTRMAALLIVNQSTSGK